MKTFSNLDFIDAFFDNAFSNPTIPPPPVPKEDIEAAKRSSLEHLQEARRCFADKTNSLYVNDIAIEEPTIIQREADYEASKIKLTPAERKRFVRAYFSLIEERITSSPLSHYERLEIFVKNIQSRFSDSRFTLPGFRKICDEFESWSRASDERLFGRSLFRHCVFFSLIRKLIRETATPVLDKIEGMLDNGKTKDFEHITLAITLMYVNYYFSSAYTACRLNITPSVMVPSALMYQEFRDSGQHYLISANSAAMFIQSNQPDLKQIKPGKYLIDLPDVAWLGEKFKLEEWTKSDETTKNKILAENKHLKDEAEYRDDLLPASFGRRHIYITATENDLYAYHADDQNVSQGILALRALDQKRYPRMWRTTIAALVQISAGNKIKQRNGYFEIGEDRSIAMNNIKGYRSWIQKA